MIGWKPRPFIFVHIPKCAGTSIEAVLLPIVTSHQHFKDLSEADRSLYWLPGKKALQHSKLRAYGRDYPLKDYFKFAFVRNPWDRAISQINYLRTKAQAPLFREKTFKQQVWAYCNTRTRIWAHNLGLSQTDYLLGKSGKMEVDFVGRFESLAADFRSICQRMSIDPVPSIPHVFNSKRQEHYSVFYDEESAEWIRRRFASDIDAFGYTFEATKRSDGGKEKALPSI